MRDRQNYECGLDCLPASKHLLYTSSARMQKELGLRIAGASFFQVPIPIRLSYFFCSLARISG